MPIASYSVLKGWPTAGKVVTGRSKHYQFTVLDSGATFTVAVNIESVDGSEVLYVMDQGFTPPDANGLAGLKGGITSLQSAPGGLALDFVREQIGGKPMIMRAQMTLLPKEIVNTVQAHALENAVVALLNAAVARWIRHGICVWERVFRQGRGGGDHNIHMNQGNPPNNHGGDNGIWQDGALFLQMGGSWTAVFLAFQTESWMTDGAGNPAAKVHRHPMLEG